MWFLNSMHHGLFIETNIKIHVIHEMNLGPWFLELYSAVNDPRLEMIPDLKWSPKWIASDPRPHMIPEVNHKCDPICEKVP